MPEAHASPWLASFSSAGPPGIWLMPSSRAVLSKASPIESSSVLDRVRVTVGESSRNREAVRRRFEPSVRTSRGWCACLARERAPALRRRRNKQTTHQQQVRHGPVRVWGSAGGALLCPPETSSVRNGKGGTPDALSTEAGVSPDGPAAEGAAATGAGAGATAEGAAAAVGSAGAAGSEAAADAAGASAVGAVGVAVASAAGAAAAGAVAAGAGAALPPPGSQVTIACASM
jgi:hypothetical protein